MSYETSLKWKMRRVPFSKANKKTLTERIMHYRDNVGTLYRKNKYKLKHIAQKDGIKGYGKLNKNDLIDTILFNRRVVKPRSKELKKLTRNQIRDLARKEGLLNRVGQKKDRMINNISHHRFGIMKNKLKDIVEDIANEKYKAIKISGSFHDGYVLHRSKGVDIEKGVVTIEDYLNKKVKRHILKLMKDSVKTGDSCKFQLNLGVEFMSTKDPNDIIKKPIWSENQVIMEGTNLDEVYEDLYESLLQQFEIVQSKLNKSNYVFHRIYEMTYHYHKVDLVRGSSYIGLPDWVKEKHCCINPKNLNDDKCFQYAVVAVLHHPEIANHPERIGNLEPFINRYNWAGITYPTQSNQWSNFEKQNPTIALNILYIEGEKRVRQAFISKYNSTREKHVDLLIVQDNMKTHYTAIKRISALLRGITSNNHGDHYCRNCLNSFRTKEVYKIHVEACKDHDYCHVKIPKEKEKWLSYVEGSKTIRAPFVIYADTECILEPIVGCDGDPNSAFTREVNRHVGCGAASLTVFAHGEWEKAMDLHRGKHSIKDWCKSLKNQVTRAIKYKQKDMKPLTSEERKSHRVAKKCHICIKMFKKEDSGDFKMRKVRDHCHYTGKYRGAAHSICNLQYRIPNFIPVVLHNRSKYDDHIYIKELAEEFDSKDFDCIGENTEKYISFAIPIEVGFKDENGNAMQKKKKNKKGEEYEVDLTKTCKLRFIDSFRFMPSSLSSLVNNLAGTNTDGIKCESCKGEMEMVEIDGDYIAHFKCKHCYSSIKSKKLDADVLKKNFMNTYKYCGGADEQFRLLLRKGVYPYEYMDNFERFEEQALPSIDKFYSELNLEGISKTDYQHAQKVWENFEIRDLGDYHDLYLINDVMLLADVFENFRDTCLSIYQLDPAHFYTSPGMAWQAALKVTGKQLELLTDQEMLLFFEKGLRGGLCQASHRYVKANNKYMGKQYDSKKDSSYIMYFDVNNEYGWAMVQKLATHGFKWVNDISMFTTDFIKNYDNGDDGYTLEVDVEYPKSLQKDHNSLPFLPEKMKLTNGIEKLTCNLFDKEKYVVHIRTLQQALEHGLVLKKVHRVIEYKQSAWLKPYIDMNTELRKKAKNDFEKDFFKLMNNSVFGKTMENVRNHRDIKLVCTERQRKWYASKPNYKSTNRFSEKLIAIELKKVQVKMNKPIYLGQSILDISKLLPYEFHYDYMKPKYEEKVTLCYTDTDSLVYYINTDDVFQDISGDVKARFDTSNYDKEDNRPLQIGVNKKEIGLMKDELGGKIITEFVALRPKLYAYRILDGKEEKKAKGTKKCVIKKQISFQDFYNCYKTLNPLYRTQLRFTSKKHVIYTIKQNKIALSANDDKRLYDDGIRTFSRGTGVGLVCKAELLEKKWHPDRVKDWCF